MRKAPALTTDNWKELSPVGIWAALAHAFSVLALGAGAVSFGQIVKAGEPVFAAATNALLLKVRMYASLVVVVVGGGGGGESRTTFSGRTTSSSGISNKYL